jgi:hypothetical protein
MLSESKSRRLAAIGNECDCAPACAHSVARQDKPQGLS